MLSDEHGYLSTSKVVVAATATAGSAACVLPFAAFPWSLLSESLLSFDLALPERWDSLFFFWPCLSLPGERLLRAASYDERRLPPVALRGHAADSADRGRFAGVLDVLPVSSVWSHLGDSLVEDDELLLLLQGPENHNHNAFDYRELARHRSYVLL